MLGVFRHYIDKEAVKLSGGNQRKLCAGIALVGHPSIVFLDEPTTGVDPEARRRIWDMIHKIAHDRHKTSAVILTTHSMEEADALCETMVIQANGQFRCLGTSQQIKSDYGRNYRLWIHFREASDDEKEQSLQQLLAYDDITMATIRDGYVTLSDTDLESRLSKLGIEGCRLVDSVLTAGTLDGTLNRTFNRGALASAVVRALQHMKALRWLMINVSSECQTLEEVGEFALPRDLDLGFIFSKLSPAHVQAELEMHDFQLSQTTLEQIFNRIAHDEAHPIQREL
ncbi:Bacitracin transport ATP-binding protein bcrA, putative [Perkinsus marinus ATCC 50983]|uniref:Bacitracin transport ATP-binding protein bcrA, putative n=1 Tax=Perkinsus marinus (strain ATCC 50983 / TXsc) TaxID=423536 RepID=C5LPZ8_PERM5|nr:Bacitracin transport ATP-binding protein bcrA, putative [Perkinsus marinus ATCC 50983]EER01195.1 Bacitracin transport ATP-binding protein bcrA, putative [Perkinsus marinus ATCC 50983]|eukprot:XP_002768477.1 Bacitracin transport ATP-binding protein bcrA, putative [Perkinsus marinus ATCC 50983]